MPSFWCSSMSIAAQLRRQPLQDYPVLAIMALPYLWQGQLPAPALCWHRAEPSQPSLPSAGNVQHRAAAVSPPPDRRLRQHASIWTRASSWMRVVAASSTGTGALSVREASQRHINDEAYNRLHSGSAEGTDGADGSNGGGGAGEQPKGRHEYAKRRMGDGAPTKQEREVQKMRADHYRDGTHRARIMVQYPVRLHGFSPLAIRSDVQRFLSDCDAKVQNIRAEYDDKMLPRVWWVDLETPEQREKALAWDGSYVGTRRIKVEAREPLAMKTAILHPLSMGSRGRYALVDGIAEQANLEEIARYFAGFELMGNPVTMVKEGVDHSRPKAISRHTPTDQMPRFKAVVRFQSHEEACRAVREKYGGFICQLPVTLRVLP